MKNKKRLLLFVFLISCIFLFTIKSVYALGMGPARVEVNFAPGLEISNTYYVYSDDVSKKLELYAAGDLAEYVEFDKKEITGRESFIATLKLPDSIEKPGEHRIHIGVREKVDEELTGTAIGTAVAIEVIIFVYVPYPGRYVEVSVNSHNVNIGEPVNFEMNVISRGKEDVDISPRIEIISQEKTVETLWLKDRFLSNQQSLKLKKTLDTTNYNPGTYNAVAIVDYGEVAEARTEFKIGELMIEILNYTDKILIKGTQKFNIEIQSGWNDRIDGAYAEVNILNSSKSLASFKTSTTELTPWQVKTITGYFDTTGFVAGIYDANMTVIYFGKDIGKNTNKIVKVEFVKESNIILIGAIILGILVILIIVIFVVKKYVFNKK